MPGVDSEYCKSDRSGKWSWAGTILILVGLSPLALTAWSMIATFNQMSAGGDVSPAGMGSGVSQSLRWAGFFAPILLLGIVLKISATRMRANQDGN
jgi:hypothetical protein